MEIRQQIVGNGQELNKILIEHLKRKGHRIDERSVEIKREGGFCALTMTEDEIYLTDTQAILKQPLSSLGVNKKLKEKLLKKFLPTETPVISSLLSTQLSNSNLQQFKTGTQINTKFLTSSTDKEVQSLFLNTAEEKLLIKTFGDLAIKVNPHERSS